MLYTKCFISSKVCNMLIDEGGCENMVLIEVADKLKLLINDPYHYKLTWFKKRNEVKATKRCLVSFSIRKRYMDGVWFDIMPINACHILLIRP